MNPKNAQQNGQGGQQDSLQAIIGFSMDVLLFIASIFAAPLEMAIRKKQGSRYQPIPVLACASIPLYFFAVAGMTVGSSLNRGGLIGIGWVCIGFTVLQWFHAYHVWRMMINPHREAYSYDDGIALPFWAKLPKGDRWNYVRFVYEPGGMILLAAVLGGLHIISAAAAMYLVFAGFALFVKVAFLWFKTWTWLRDLLDQLGLSTKMSGGKTQGGMDAVKAAVARAARNIPMSLPPAVIESVKETAKQSLPPELNKLISESLAVAEVETKSVEQGVLELLSPPNPAR